MFVCYCLLSETHGYGAYMLPQSCLTSVCCKADVLIQAGPRIEAGPRLQAGGLT